MQDDVETSLGHVLTVVILAGVRKEMLSVRSKRRELVTLSVLK